MLPIRPATENDAQDIAYVLGQGVKVDMPFLPVLHTAEDDLAYTKGTILKDLEVWVGTDKNDRAIGFISFKDGWINQFFVLNEYQGKGLGKGLLEKAKISNERLELWTMQKSHGARQFYEASGFKAVEFTEGKNNEENEPDVRYLWQKGMQP